MDNNMENQTPENTSENTPENAPENTSENITENAPENTMENIPDNKPEKNYTDPNAGAVYEEPSRKQEAPRTTISYTYGAPHTGESRQPSGQTEGASDRNTAYSYGNHASGGSGNGTYTNNNYGNSSYNGGYQSEGMDTSPLSMGEWILTLLVSVVPCVGLIFYFIWAFDRNGNINRRNYCRASLIMTLVGFVICIIFFAVIMVAGFSSFYYY